MTAEGLAQAYVQKAAEFGLQPDQGIINNIMEQNK